MPARRFLLTVALPAAILCLFALGVALRATLPAWNLPTDHIDGAFQTASALFRLHAGELPGRDFLLYLGIGPVFALFPAFWAAGGDFAASQAASHAVIWGCGWLAATVLWRALRPETGALAAAAAGAGLITLFAAVAGEALGRVAPGIDAAVDGLAAAVPGLDASFIRSPLGYYAEPGLSLRPLRAIAPYLAAGAFLGLARSGLGPVARAAWFGAALGLLATWSNDYAAPTIAMFSLLQLASLIAGRRRVLPAAAAFLAALVASAALALTVATGGGAPTLLRYFLEDVGPAQWWYYAPYREIARIFDAGDLARLLSVRSAPAVAVAGAMVLRLAWRWDDAWAAAAAVGLTLLGGGALATIGGHFSSGYFSASQTWAALTLAALAAGALLRLAPPRAGAALGLGASALALALCGAFAADQWARRDDATARAADPSLMVRSEALGGHLPVAWADYLALAEARSDAVAIEEYWGVWSAATRGLGPWRVDSAIHALGAVREQSAAALAQADLVITTAAAMDPEWSTWMISQNFWLYEPLLRGWRPVATSPNTAVWERRETEVAFAPAGCRVAADGAALELTATQGGYAAVEARYRAPKGGRALVLFDNGFVRPHETDGFVSADPAGASVRFPAALAAPGTHRFAVEGRGAAKGRVELLGCSAQMLPGAVEAELRVILPDPRG